MCGISQGLIDFHVRNDVYRAMQILDACGTRDRRKRVCRRRDYVSVVSVTCKQSAAKQSLLGNNKIWAIYEGDERSFA